jgi:adenylate cyclase
MAKKEIDRKVAIILATDVVNYSKHMEANESETVRNLRACELILQKVIKKHDGRLFNSGGDSFFIEFPSAVEAVECAVAFQNDIKKRNSSDIITVPLEFRIGISMGDVIKEKENLLGDGVNIAARLEALAQTNGITISKNIYDLVKAKTSHQYNDLGIQKVKKNEFHAYDILLDPSQKRKLKTQKSNRPILAIAASFLVIAVVSFFYINQVNKSTSTSDISSLNTILVYPFKNITDPENKNRFSEALTESMIGSLSRYKGIRILSSSTSFFVKENEMSPSEIFNKYAVNYIVTGSIQTFGDNSRINLELTDAKKDTVVWSNKIDFEISDIFKAQEKIGNEILEYLQINLVAGSGTAAEKLGTPERLIISLNARDEWRKFNPEGYNKYNELTDQLAQQIGEDNPFITLNRAYGLFQKLRIGLSEEPSKDIEKLDILLDEVLESDLRVNALHFKGIVELVFLSKDCDVAKDYAKQAIELGRTVDAYTTTGTIYFLCKDYDLSIKSFRNALAVVPNDNGWFITRYLVPSMYRGGYKDGIKTILEPIIDATDMPANLLAYYSFIKLKEGDLDSAKLYLQRAKNMGLTKKYLTRYEMDEDTFSEFESELKIIGEIE